MTQQTALEYLQKDRILNMDMMECIVHQEAKIVQVCADGVLLSHPAAQVYMISADSEETMRRLMSQIDHAQEVVIHQEQFLPLVQEAFGLTEATVCHQAVYTGSTLLPEPESSLTFRTLDETYLSFLCENYTRGSRDYLSERLQAGVMTGAFAGTEITAFMGMHAEGSMGLLEVLPQFRRRGIAQALEIHYLNTLLRQGRIPYGQIIVGNEASIRLHEKLGFTFSKGTVTWVH
ncbi:GNAT family N-acetyltransferase [Caproiciproducens sp. LBM24188]|nr:GNAT family N-acetyltransferase [Clostridiales bacterium]